MPPDAETPAQGASRRSHYSYEDLLACARGELFGPGNAQLPLPPMLMFDRITYDRRRRRRRTARARSTAELDINPDLWFFNCHFQGDPVMPGCLGLDALWQMVGFFLGWLGAPGRGRALGVGEVKFTGQVLPTDQEGHLQRRHEARDHAQAGAGHRRRLARGRRQAHLRGQGHAGRPVHEPAAARRPDAGSRDRASARSARCEDTT